MLYSHLNFILFACLLSSLSRVINTADVFDDKIVPECDAEEFWQPIKEVGSKTIICAVEGGAGDVAPSPMFVARARHDNGWLSGQYFPYYAVTYVGWKSKVFAKPIFQVAYSCSVRWELSAKGQPFPARALTAGRAPDGRLNYPCRHVHNNQINIGRIFPEDGICLIPFMPTEIAFLEYEVLVVEKDYKRCRKP